MVGYILSGNLPNLAACYGAVDLNIARVASSNLHF